MAQRKPEGQDTLSQVLRLVDQLTPEEVSELRRKLDAKAWKGEWQALINEVDAQNKRLPPLTEEEIMTEVNAVREEMKAERAQESSH